MNESITMSTGDDSRRSDHAAVVRAAWRVTLAAMLYWSGAIVALHLSDTGLDPLRRPISSYLNTSARPLATTWFFALSLMMGSSIVWLRAGSRPGILRMMGSAVFGLVAAAIILAGLTPTGLSATHRSLHMVGGVLTFPPLLLGVTVWTVGLIRSRTPSTTIQLLLVGWALGMVVAFVAGVTYGEAHDLGGLFQRSVFICLIAWLIVAKRAVRGGGAVGDKAEVR